MPESSVVTPLKKYQHNAFATTLLLASWCRGSKTWKKLANSHMWYFTASHHHDTLEKAR